MKTTYIVTSGCISRENLGARPGGKYPGLFPKWDLGDEGANPRQPKLAVCHWRARIGLGARDKSGGLCTPGAGPHRNMATACDKETNVELAQCFCSNDR